MPVPPYFLDLALLALVGTAAATDLARRRIPNRLLLAGLVTAATLHLAGAAPASAPTTNSNESPGRNGITTNPVSQKMIKVRMT